MNGLAWVYLIVAGVFEIGWPVGLKMAQAPGRVALGVVVAGVCMILSGLLLFLAQRTIPIGTAYAVWTGIGASGTFVVGVLAYGDGVGMLRVLAVLMIVAGVGLLKFAH